MFQTVKSQNNMMVSPHWMATQAGSEIMKSGGNAVEAMICSAAVISVVYPHMNSLGGDNFWLMNTIDQKLIGIESTGFSSEKATIDFYNSIGLKQIPSRGDFSAITVPGVVSGWMQAYKYSLQKLNGKKTLAEILDPAIQIANSGFLVTSTLEKNLKSKKSELINLKEFANKYYSNELIEGSVLKFPEMAETFKLLIKNGFDDFYRGETFKKIFSDLKKTNCILTENDFKSFNSRFVEPIQLSLDDCKVYNLPPPTQGVASLLILGILNKLKHKCESEFNFIHSIVEATKKSFILRDKYVTDPDYMRININDLINDDLFSKLANEINYKKALEWPITSQKGDTVWLGSSDQFGNSVSFIQSIFWEFGSGIYLPETGITLQNRGASFSLNSESHNALCPRRRPFHTIQPALAKFNDGRCLLYGTMGGDGQPQTQATIFLRYKELKQNLQDAINNPRWLLGKTWGDDVHNLRLEKRFDDKIINRLIEAGHEIQLVDDFDEIMGHAGAIVTYQYGNKEAGFDLRSDGIALGN